MLSINNNINNKLILKYLDKVKFNNVNLKSEVLVIIFLLKPKIF